MKKQLKKMLALVAFCGVIALSSQIKTQNNIGQLFVGIGYYAGSHGTLLFPNMQKYILHIFRLNSYIIPILVFK